MLTVSSFKDLKNKHDVYRSKNCMKNFCERLKKNASRIISFKKMNSLTNEQQELHENAKTSILAEKKFEQKYAKDEKYLKARDYCILKVTIVFYNGSKYDYHFITVGAGLPPVCTSTPRQFDF